MFTFAAAQSDGAALKRLKRIDSEPEGKGECDICGVEDEMRNPLVLPCGHYYCKGCLREWMRNQQIGEDRC